MMADCSEITSTSRCYSCLSRTDEKQLQMYTIHQISIKTLLQTEQLILCYICKKVARNAEQFLHNVQSAQNLFKKFKNVTLTDEDVKGLMKLSLDLTVSLFNEKDIIEINSPDTQSDEKVKVEYDNDLEHSNDLPELETDFIKQEHNESIIEEKLSDDENLAKFVDNLENKYAVKEERKGPIKLPEKELKSKKSRKKPQKKRKTERNIKKVKPKMKTQSNDNINEIALEGEIDSKIVTLVLTNEQCLEERAQKRLNKLYLNSEFKCVDCIKGFTYKPSYVKHMEKHSKISGDYECDICKLRVISGDKLNIHKKYHTVRYSCTECSIVRICRTSIEDHVSTAHGTGLQFKCPKCNKGFERKTSLRKHLYNSHKDKIQCVYCNKFYATKESIKAHIFRRHPAEVSANKPARKYPCAQCGMVCESPSQLSSHSAKHSRTKDYYCVECDKSFKTHTSLQQHFKTVSVHVTPDDLKYPCPKCKKRFTTRGHAQRHLNDVHIKNARYYCDQCGKEFRCKYKLAYHLQIHAGFDKPRKFMCTICNKGFHLKRILDGHLRIHTGEKPYHCELCYAQFNQYGSLYNHKKLVHKIIGKHAKEETTTQPDENKMEHKT